MATTEKEKYEGSKSYPSQVEVIFEMHAGSKLLRYKRRLHSNVIGWHFVVYA